MTEVASAWEPEQQLSELIRIRVEMLNAVHQGRFDEAAELVTHALEVVQSGPELPDALDSVVPLTQVAGLFGDAALIEIGRGDLESAARYLSWMADVQARLSSLTEPLMLVGVERCEHGRRTLKPNGKCQFKPPCPP